MKPVKSSHIKSMKYDPQTQTLEIIFNNADHITYSYHGVSEKDYKIFEGAKSHGTHFHKHIKDKFLSRKKDHGRKKRK